MGDFKRGNSRTGGGFRGKPSFGHRGFGKRSGGFDRGGDRPTMHQAVCNKCGNDCEVPFRPSEDRPVFCNDCFERPTNDRGSDRFGKGSFSRPSSFGPKKMFRVVCDKCGESCEVPFQPRSGKPVHCSKCFDQKRDSQSDTSSAVAKKLDMLDSKLDLILKSLKAEVVKPMAVKEDVAEKAKATKKDKKTTKAKVVASKAKKTVKKSTKK